MSTTIFKRHPLASVAPKIFKINSNERKFVSNIILISCFYSDSNLMIPEISDQSLPCIISYIYIVSLQRFAIVLAIFYKFHQFFLHYLKITPALFSVEDFLITSRNRKDGDAEKGHNSTKRKVVQTKKNFKIPCKIH